MRIQLAAGRTLAIKDDTTAGSRFIVHRYAGHLERIHSHLIELRRYEGGSYLLIDDSTGDSTRIPGIPVISPNGTRFVAMSLDMEAGYDPNLIEVWYVGAHENVKEFSFESETWGPSDAVWRDSVTVDFTTNFMDESPANPYRKVPARLTRTGGTWVLLESLR